jgi:hypothetical protein
VTRSMPLVDSDINWHDGVLVDIQLAGFAEKAQRLTLVVELYPDRDPKAKRRRFVCVGENVSRFLVSGDIGRLIKNSGAGNIDYMRMDFTANSEILVVCLFGGMIEAEAASFELAEGAA